MRPEVLNFLFTHISNLNGIGEKTLKNYKTLLQKKRQLASETQIPKMLDLLFHLPDRFLQRKFVENVKDISSGDIVIAKVKVISHSKPTRSKQPYIITCYLGNNFVNIVYYKYFENYINLKFKIDSEIFISGKVDIYNSQIQIVHPDYISNNLVDIPKIEAIYPLTYGVVNKEVAKNIDIVLKQCPNLPEWLDNDILQKNNWYSWKESLTSLHKPTNMFDAKNNRYRRRLAFDEILAQQLIMSLVRYRHKNKLNKNVLENNKKELKNNFIQNILPFSLTNDQAKVINEIESDTFSNKKMNRLLQGDVGSGKTIVALITMLNYVENKKQCALMVPTSILASQHFINIKELCDNINVKVELLTGKIKGKKRKEILEQLKSGEIDILVGTHALIEDNVDFKDLGYVVIDEQHRFGVEQRLNLINKNKDTDILAMSATPIPRTLALTIYNDMDLSIIQEKPKNRKEIQTSIITTDKYDDLINRIKEKIKNDEKIYWICPLVEESENMELTDVKNKYDEFCEIFGSEAVSLIHGKMKEKDKDIIMEEFCNNENKKILISTTVIEVGIDVKNATVIVIDHPERFGLSQLHQLRGRVGRGDKQSYCILLYNSKNGGKNTLRRLNIMRSTTNGFTIAEQDLKIRGIGEVMGLKQSGQQDYVVADLSDDFDLLEQAIYYAQNIVKNNEVSKYSLLLYLFGYANFCVELLN